MNLPSPPVRAGDELRLEIADLAFGGRGVARTSGFVVFVKGALPGEVARVRVRRVRPGYAEGECLEVLVSSRDRVAPPCRHFGECGGCDPRHLARRAEAEAQRAPVQERLARRAGVRGPSAP